MILGMNACIISANANDPSMLAYLSSVIEDNVENRVQNRDETNCWPSRDCVLVQGLIAGGRKAPKRTGPVVTICPTTGLPMSIRLLQAGIRTQVRIVLHRLYNRQTVLKRRICAYRSRAK